MKNVLILCTGNSARSIMAEYLVNSELGDSWRAVSAGVNPSVVNPYAIAAMAELGIALDSARSKSVDEFLHREDLDLIVTVCDHARETCPVFTGTARQHHMAFEDPAPFSDQREEIALGKFRDVRDQIRNKLLPYLAERG